MFRFVALEDGFQWYDSIGFSPFIPGSLGRAVDKYDVGLFSDLRKASAVGDNLDLHHAPQRNPASQVIPNYDPDNAPTIVLPKDEHIELNSENIIGPYLGTARDLMAKTINDLRAVTNAPNSALWQLLSLVNQIYPGALGK